VSIKNSIIFPRAFAFAIDDLGWNDGSDLSGQIPAGPFRAGVDRKFTQKDYEVIVEVGKAVGARIQSLFILSEMDRENILAGVPHATHQGRAWNNSFRVNDLQKAIMNYIVKSSAHMEFGLHGTGHEYWAADGIQRRAEWYNLKDREPWPEESLRQHIQAFKEIMAQYNITPDLGHSFPESFVPCAYSYYWNPKGKYSLGKLLAEAGVKYANTDFSEIPELSPPHETNGGGFDHGTHVINRLNYGNLWSAYATLPNVPLELHETDIIESHWPNWLAAPTDLQSGITSQWINYYKRVQRSPNRYIAKNTEQLHSQWLYNRYTIISETKSGVVEIDNSNMPEEAYRFNLLGNLVLKLKLADGQHVNSSSLDNELIPAYFEDQGYAFLYLPSLHQQKYTLVYSIGRAKMPLHVFHDGTYNVYSLNRNQNEITITLKMYGQQTVRINCSKPANVISVTHGLKIERHRYEDITSLLYIEIAAANMQGTRGTIRIIL
jgi:hypothetical protein